MATDERSFRVRSGQRVFGPMTVTDLAELLATERLRDSDLVSVSGGPWVRIEEYVAGQSSGQTPSQLTPEAPDARREGGPRERQSRTGRRDVPSHPPAQNDEPLSDSSGPGPDSDYVLDSTAVGDPYALAKQPERGDANPVSDSHGGQSPLPDAEPAAPATGAEPNYIPLSEALDPSPSGTGDSSSTGHSDFYRVPPPPPPVATTGPAVPAPGSPSENRPPARVSGVPQPAGPKRSLADELELDDALEELAREEAGTAKKGRRRQTRTGPKQLKRSSSRSPKRKRKRR